MSQSASIRITDFPSPPLEKSGWPWTESSELMSERMPDGSDWPTISIVTPSYNQGQFIEETIRSVLLQGYPNLEYIIIDGGSTDNTVDIIKKYEPWITYWVSENDSGQSHALNNGFQKANGDICAYINSDDIYLINAFKSLSKYFKSLEKYKWISANVIQGTSIHESRCWKPFVAKLQYFAVNQTIAQPGVFWSRDVLCQPWFDENRTFNMDHKFFLDIYVNKNPPYLVDETVAYFRMHSASKTYERSERWSEEHESLLNEFKAKLNKPISKEIELEQKRIINSEVIDLLLKKKSLERGDLRKSLYLLADTPYLFRDRIFISGVIRLVFKSIFYR